MMTPDKDSSEHLLTNGATPGQHRRDKVSFADLSARISLKIYDKMWRGYGGY